MPQDPVARPPFVRVVCPWHGWTFDVRTGHPDHPSGHSVAAYHMRVEAGAVYVGWLKR